MSSNKDDTFHLWGARFSSSIDPLMEQFNASLPFDKRLYSVDVRASIAYTKALLKVGLLTQEEATKITDGLTAIENEWKNKTFVIKPGDEDIHTANERRLNELIGSHIGGKLHTGRSRNDQIATDMKLWLRESYLTLDKYLLKLIQKLVNKAEKESNVIMPGYTHLQRAQPILMSQWLLSYAFMLQQDQIRLTNNLKTIDYCPLGSGAIAGNPFNIDRFSLAKDLNFKNCTPNSMYAVGDRDFIVEFQLWSSLTLTHLSRLAEDVIIYSSKEFDFIALSDEYTTGSSLMPQKRNPDSLELIRGKSGRVLGHLVAILTILKGTPSTFNKDLQEDKEGMFDTYDNMLNILQIAAGIIASFQVNSDKCSKALTSDMLATDVANYLVKKGMPFREAHQVVGKAVAMADKLNCSLSELSFSKLKELSSLFSEDVQLLWDFKNSVNQYTVLGGTAQTSVNQQINQLRNWIYSASNR